MFEKSANVKKNSKYILLVLIIAAIACVLFASRYFSDTRVEFQRKSVPSPVLEYGGTGEILRELKLIEPTDSSFARDQRTNNIADIIVEAGKVRKKWLKYPQYAHYKENGIFCYIKLQTNNKEVPTHAACRNGDTWIDINNALARPGDADLGFFFDNQDNEFPLQLEFFNTEDSVSIESITFLRKGFHPIVFFDTISFGNIDYTKGASGRLEGQFLLLEKRKTNTLHMEIDFQEKWKTGISKLLKKQGNTNFQLGTVRNDQKNNDDADEQRYLEQSRNGVPIVVISASEENLYSEQYGILKNYANHGSEWERFAHFDYYENGKRVLNDPVGIRLQGGDPGRAKGLINFRIAYREKYGVSSIDGGLLFPGEKFKLKRLAVKRSEWEDWPLNTPIAYKISRQIGSLAPPARFVHFYLNNKSLGIYYIVPHLAERQIKEFYPEADMSYYRHRGNNDWVDIEFFQQEFWEWIKSKPSLQVSTAGQMYDLENLSLQLFSFLINGTGDYCQGVVLKDEKCEGPMFWYTWDMDWSYVDVWTEKKHYGSPGPRWMQSPRVETFFQPENGNTHYCPRVHLFRRLVNEDPGYMHNSQHLLLDVLLHRLDDQKINVVLYEAWRALEAVHQEYTQQYIAALSEFFLNRRYYLVQRMRAVFQDEIPVYTINKARHPLIVDGYTKTGLYEGAAFTDQIVTVALSNDEGFRYWLVDKKIIKDKELHLSFSDGSPHEVSAVYGP